MIETADQAVNDFICKLPADRREELGKTALQSQCEEHWHWYREVIDRYDLRNQNSPVVRDIRLLFNDPDGAESLIFSRSDEPVLDADRLLRLAQSKLRSARPT